MNGYLKAFHDIFDSLALYGVTGTKFHLFYYIFRKTIGWNKYVDQISITQFIKETGLSRQGILNGLSWLEEKKWIYVMEYEPKGGGPNQYSLGEAVYHQTGLKVDRSKLRPVTGLKVDHTTGLNLDQQKKEDLKETKKETTTTIPDTGNIPEGESDVPREEEEVVVPVKNIAEDSTELQAAIQKKWKCLTLPPSQVDCITALQEYGGLQKLLEALTRCPSILKYKTPSAALNLLCLYAENTTWGVHKGTGSSSTKKLTPEEKKLYDAIRKLKELRAVTPGGDSEVPGVVNFISRNTGKPPEAILAEYNFPRTWGELNGT